MKKNQKQETPSYIPEGILTPDEVMTSLGLLRFNDGVPTRATAQKVYDFLDTMRGADAFLKGMPAASLRALLMGMRSLGARYSRDVVITESLLDSIPLFLTGNTSTVYALIGLDLRKSGPTIVEIPDGALGAFNNAWFRYLADVGDSNKYVVLPPDPDEKFSRDLPIIQSDSYKVWIFLRFGIDEGIDLAVETAKQIRVYPEAEQDSPPETGFYNVSEKEVNTIHHNDFTFYEELNAVIQEEPLELIDKETRGLFASIGIEKDKDFKPDDRMKAILTDAVAIGNAAARSIVWYPRTQGSVDNMYGIQFFPESNSAWVMVFLDKNVFFDGENHQTMNSDARTTFHYPYTAVTPSMAVFKEEEGSDYAIAFLDADKNPFDGSKVYQLHLPAGIPAAKFWAVTLYDTQTRSLLQTSQPFPTVGSQTEGIYENPKDGSYDIYFAPNVEDVPIRYKRNWLETIPGKSWFVVIRLYGPTEAWNEGTWQPDEIKLVPRKAEPEPYN